jgi:hypothetical protein
MSSTIKFGFSLIVILILNSCVISNPKPEECEIIEITVLKIYEGGIKDIVLEAGMEDKVLNKKVILHLAKTITGTTAHRAQLALENEIIFY